jgi:hypothetical protein
MCCSDSVFLVSALGAVFVSLAACQTNPQPAAPGGPGPVEAEQSALARACTPGSGPAVSDDLRRRVAAAGSLAVLVRLRVPGADPSRAAIARGQQTLLDELASTATSTTAMGDTAGLFTDPPGVPALDLARDVGVIRNRYVGVRFGLLPGSLGSEPQTLALNLFDDAVLTGVIEQVDSTPSGSTIVGRLQGIENSSMTLVTNDGVMIGSISTPAARYQIRYAGNGVHAVREFDTSQLPPELPAVPAPGGTGGSSQTFAVTATFTTVPLLGLQVTARALEALAVSPQVACVGEDLRPS